MSWLTVSDASGYTLIRPMQFVQTRSLAIGRRNPRDGSRSTICQPKQASLFVEMIVTAGDQGHVFAV